MRQHSRGQADLQSAVHFAASIAQARLDAVQLVHGAPAALRGFTTLALTRQPSVHQGLSITQTA